MNDLYKSKSYFYYGFDNPKSTFFYSNAISFYFNAKSILNYKYLNGCKSVFSCLFSGGILYHSSRRRTDDSWCESSCECAN